MAKKKNLINMEYEATKLQIFNTSCCNNPFRFIHLGFNASSRIKNNTTNGITGIIKYR